MTFSPEKFAAETALSAPAICALTKMITGKPAGKLSNKIKTVNRFALAMVDALGEKITNGHFADIMAAEGKEIAEGLVQIAIEAADEKAAPADEPVPAKEKAPEAKALKRFNGPDLAGVKAAPADAKPLGKIEDPHALRAKLESGELRHTEKRLAIIAQAGLMPPAPDFTAETHARFRPLLGQVESAAKQGNLKALRAVEINPISSSPKAIARYRDAAIVAIEAAAS